MTFKFFYLNFCFFRLFLDYTHFRWFSFLIFSISYGLCFLFSPHFMVLNFLKIFPLKKSFGNSIVTSGYISGLGLGLRSSQLKTFFFLQILEFWLEILKDSRFLFAVMPLYEMNYWWCSATNIKYWPQLSLLIEFKKSETTKGQRGS